MGPYPPTYKQIIPREHTPEDKMLLAREIVDGVHDAGLSPAGDRGRGRPRAEAGRAGRRRGRELRRRRSAWACRRCWSRRTSCSASSSIPSRTIRRRCARSTTTSWPRGCRTSCGAACPTTSCSRMPGRARCARRQSRRSRCGGCWPIPKAQALVENFAGQWLQLRNLKIASPDQQPFPELRRAAARRRCARRRSCSSPTIVREDRSVLDFLDADFTFVNERLARHYGIRGRQGRRVPPGARSTGDQRGGVLTQASVLTVTSNPTRTSPVKRGKWVLEKMLGTPPPPPPPDVPALSEDAARDAHRLAAPADGAAPRQARAAPSATTAWTRSASASRTSTRIGAWRDEGRRVRRSTPPARCPAARSFDGPARAEGDSQGPAGRFRPLPGRKDADLCPGPGRRV